MKQDHRRVSKEKHEIAYIRKLAKGLIKKIDVTETRIKTMNVYGLGKDGLERVEFTFSEIKRVAKTLLKLTKGYTRRKK